jgi:hypothetical protein
MSSLQITQNGRVSVIQIGTLSAAVNAQITQAVASCLASMNAAAASAAAAAAGGGLAPYEVPAGNTLVIPLNAQAVFALPITIDGTLQVDGALIGVL